MTTSRRDNPCKDLEDTVKEIPEFVDLAREVIKGWEAGKTFLLPTVAKGLRDAYEMGRKGRKPKAKVWAEEPEEEEEEQQAPAVRRVRRTR
jgi:hypothetical protein